jgi:hypothetical protein
MPATAGLITPDTSIIGAVAGEGAAFRARRNASRNLDNKRKAIRGAAADDAHSASSAQRLF